MSESSPLLGDPQDEFSLPPRTELSLPELLANADLDQVHFFLKEAIRDEEISHFSIGENTRFALIPYTHPDRAIDDRVFDALKARDLQPASLRDLLNLAIERPNLQREYDIVALATLRTRRVHKDRPGETTWHQTERDRSICQWATGLSSLKTRRTLIPLELYLNNLLPNPTLLLVHAP